MSNLAKILNINLEKHREAIKEAFNGKECESNLSLCYLSLLNLITNATHHEGAFEEYREEITNLVKLNLKFHFEINRMPFKYQNHISLTEAAVLYREEKDAINNEINHRNELNDETDDDIHVPVNITKEEFSKRLIDTKETAIKNSESVSLIKSETIQKIAEEHLSPESLKEFNSPTITLTKYPFTFDPKYGLPFEEFIKIIDPDNNISKEDFNKEIDLYNVNNAIINKYIKENLNLERIIGFAKDKSGIEISKDEIIQSVKNESIGIHHTTLNINDHKVITDTNEAIKETTITSNIVDVTKDVTGFTASNVKCFVPTNEFRYLKPQYDLSAFGGPNETKLQQKFIDKFTGYHEWRDIPSVSAGSQADY